MTMIIPSSGQPELVASERLERRTLATVRKDLEEVGVHVREYGGGTQFLAVYDGAFSNALTRTLFQLAWLAVKSMSPARFHMLREELERIVPFGVMPIDSLAERVLDLALEYWTIRLNTAPPAHSQFPTTNGNEEDADGVAL